MEHKIGIGYDIHRLVAGRKLILGGVEIPFERGLVAYSDGDVLTHSICDAILGAAGLADIGVHFPNGDKKYQGISSLELLKMSLAKIQKAGYRVANIDCVLIADKPSLGPYRNKMTACLARFLKIQPGLVNLKATTNEGIGAVGSQAIASYSVALLVKE